MTACTAAAGVSSSGDAGCGGDAGSCGTEFDCPTLTCTCRVDGMGIDAGATMQVYSIDGSCSDGCCNTCPATCQ